MSLDTRKFRRLAPLMMAELMREFSLGEDDAAAIAGNGGHESRGFTLLQEQRPTKPGSLGGLGWFQWTGVTDGNPRRRNFVAWCERKGLTAASYEANVGFLIHELRTTEKRALTALRGASGLAAKTLAFERAFERSGVKHDDKRLWWAELALAAWREKGANAKPLATSRTAAGSAAAAAGGAAVIADTVASARDTVQQASESWSTGTWIGIALGALIVAAGLLALYARWDDAGRPWPGKAAQTPVAPPPGDDAGAPAEASL